MNSERRRADAERIKAKRHKQIALNGAQGWDKAGYNWRKVAPFGTCTCWMCSKTKDSKGTKLVRRREILRRCADMKSITEELEQEEDACLYDCFEDFINIYDRGYDGACEDDY